MTEDISNEPQHSPEILTEQDDPSTPLRHQPEQKAPEPTPEPSAPKSVSDSIKAALEKVTKEDAEPEKVDAKEKPAPKVDAEPKEVVAEKPDEAGAEDDKKPAQSEGRVDRIPSRLLPKEREVWANVPNAVKAAWDRMEREYAESTQKYEPAAKFYEELKQYDDMAKSANTTVKVALDRYVTMDKQLAANFGHGMTQIAQAHGKNPVEAVAQFMRAAGVLPQQLGAYLQGNPAPQQQAQPQSQPRPDPVAQAALQEVQQLKQMLIQQQHDASIGKVEADIVGPFFAENPGAQELQDDIVFFLKSGKIPNSLSPVEKLEAAFDMAVRINPTSVKAQENLAEPAVKAPNGVKSISGAPGKSSTSSGKPKIMSVRESIAAAMRTA